MTNSINISKIINWIFGILVLAIGIINTFWGNDPEFGVFIILSSLVYFLPVPDFIAIRTGPIVPVIAKVLLGLFIIWAAFGVGELFDKVDLMLQSIQQNT